MKALNLLSLLLIGACFTSALPAIFGSKTMNGDDASSESAETIKADSAPRDPAVEVTIPKSRMNCCAKSPRVSGAKSNVVTRSVRARKREIPLTLPPKSRLVR
jgi:hypothetical protein